jgi:hypothetical protein
VRSALLVQPSVFKPGHVSTIQLPPIQWLLDIHSINATKSIYSLTIASSFLIGRFYNSIYNEYMSSQEQSSPLGEFCTKGLLGQRINIH